MASHKQTHDSVSARGTGSGEPSTESSANHSRDSSRPSKPRNRVRFTPSTPGGQSSDNTDLPPASDSRPKSDPSARPTVKPLPFPRPTSLSQRSQNAGAVSHPIDSDPGEDVADSSIPKLSRPGFIREQSSSNAESSEDDVDNGLEMNSEAVGKRLHSQQTAQERGERLSRKMGSSSAPGSRTASPYRHLYLYSPPPSPPPRQQRPPTLDFENIPLERLHSRRTYGIEDENDEDDEQEASKKRNPFLEAAGRLIRHHSKKGLGKENQKPRNKSYKVTAPPTPLRSGQVTPIQEQRDRDYVPRPGEYREGFLSSILKLYDERGVGSALFHTPVGNVAPSVRGRRPSSASSLLPTQGKQEPSPASSGVSTPKAKREKWYANKQTASTGSLSNLSSLVYSTTVLAHPGGSPATAPTGENGHLQGLKPLRPQLKSRSVSALDTMLGRRKGPKVDDSIHIQVHIAETMTRQAYLMKMCKALMNYGAPTHRLEGMHEIGPKTATYTKPTKNRCVCRHVS